MGGRFFYQAAGNLCVHMLEFVSHFEFPHAGTHALTASSVHLYVSATTLAGIQLMNPKFVHFYVHGALTQKMGSRGMPAGQSQGIYAFISQLSGFFRDAQVDAHPVTNSGGHLP